MAVVKSLKNKKHKREWVKNLGLVLKIKHKHYKFNFYKVKKISYIHTKLNKFSRLDIKQKFAVYYQI